MSDTKIEPCPYCPDGTNNIKVDRPNYSDRTFVVCKTCWMQGPIKATKKEAIEAWNKVAARKWTDEDMIAFGTYCCIHQNGSTFYEMFKDFTNKKQGKSNA